MMKQKHTGRRSRLLSLLCVGVVSIGLTAMLYSCYPGDPISTSDTDMVTTFRDKDANFANQSTYAIPDFVISITDTGAAIGNGPNDQTILNAIKRNMTAKGYTVADTSVADVIVIAIVTSTDWAAGGCYPSYWCSWYYCYPGWCYPVAYTYTTGSIIILMLDRDNSVPAGGTENATPLWIAGINGLITGSVSKARIDNNIDQAFTQSPYLGGN